MLRTHNPYRSPVVIDTAKPLCTRCRGSGYETTPQVSWLRFGFESVVIGVLLGFALVGMCRAMDVTGVVVWIDGEAHFWFEEALREWIWKCSQKKY